MLDSVFSLACGLGLTPILQTLKPPLVTYLLKLLCDFDVNLTLFLEMEL